MELNLKSLEKVTNIIWIYCLPLKMPKILKKISSSLITFLQAFQILIKCIRLCFLFFFLTVLLECLTGKASMKFLNFDPLKPLHLCHLHAFPTEIHHLSFLEADDMCSPSLFVVGTWRPLGGSFIVDWMGHLMVMSCPRSPRKGSEGRWRAMQARCER